MNSVELIAREHVVATARSKPVNIFDVRHFVPPLIYKLVLLSRHVLIGDFERIVRR